MPSRRFGNVIVTLPDFDAAGDYLSVITQLDVGRGLVQDFAYIGERLRDLDLTSIRLMSGRIAGVEADRIQLSGTQLHSVELTDCTFGAWRAEGSKFSRVVFRDCRLTGATFEDCTFDDVLFEKCRLDYATLAEVRAVGPVAFTNCTLGEAELTRNDLADETAIDSCVLRQTAFRPGNYRGIDLRGSDLTQITGAVNLTGAVISPDQEPQLAQALLAALNLTITNR